MNENLIKPKDFRQIDTQIKKKDIKIESENSDYILKQIHEMKITIESKLENFDEKQEKSEIEKSFSELNDDYERLNKYINDSSLYLAKYNLKSVQTLLNSIRSKIDIKRDQLIPKSKFSFKSSLKMKPKSVETVVKAIDQIDSSNSKMESKESNPFFGFKNIVNCETTLRMTKEETFGKDLQLDGLEKCRIEITGAPNTIKVNDLTDCQVFCGPTTTSILVANCKKCLFRICGQQIRIHGSTECDFYIHVTSRAIIEDSKQIRFAPFDWTYDEINEDFVSAKLDPNTNNWQQIDDFDSLSDKPSNNWSFIDSNSN